MISLAGIIEAVPELLNHGCFNVMGSSQHHGCFFSHGVAALGYCYEPVAQHSLRFHVGGGSLRWFVVALHRLERIAPRSAPPEKAMRRTGTNSCYFFLGLKTNHKHMSIVMIVKISCVRASGCLCYHAIC